MFSRFAVGVLQVTVLLSTASYAQEKDVVLGSAKDRFGLMACGVDGRTYFSRRFTDPDPSSFGAGALSVLRVSRDGSILTFQFPKQVSPVLAAAFDVSGVNVLAAFPHRKDEDWRYAMYRLDNQANLLGHYPVAIDFHPMQMAVLPSGKTIIAGHLESLSRSHRDEWTYVGAVLDADGGAITRFDFPSPPDGGKWTFPARQRMMAGDGAAYIVLETDSESDIGIAKILETGRVDIKVIPEPPDDDQHRHHIWLLGPGVAVEEYNYRGEQPYRWHYDEYDLDSGEKTATRISSGGSAQCYFGAEVAWTTPGTRRLVFSKLENQAASPPPAGH